MPTIKFIDSFLVLVRRHFTIAQLEMGSNLSPAIMLRKIT